MRMGYGKTQIIGEVKWQGYVWYYLPNHPLSNNTGWVKRSKVVMEGIIGRYLTPEEIVDHKNLVKDDDRPENLRLFPNRAEHDRFHTTERCPGFKEGNIPHNVKKGGR